MALAAALLLGATAVSALPGLAADQATATAGNRPRPIVFVHGNGDSKAIWTTVLWRFESQGYPHDRLFAIDLANPTARDVDAVPQPGRSSTAEAKDQLAAFVQEVLAETGAGKVALVGSSRGGNTIRNYLKNGGGAPFVTRVVIGGGISHGVVSSPAFPTGSEFNGLSDFLQQLNAGPSEVVAGIPFLTLRSNRFDKFAQPDAKYLLGFPGVPTGVSFDAPALKGARNLIVRGIDHRETAVAPVAFGQEYTFLTDRVPASLGIRRERVAVLNGEVTGVTDGNFNNIGVAGAKVQVFAVDPATGRRKGAAVHRVTTGADGRWGPFRADPATFYEFVVEVPGQPKTHIYRSPFPRGSSLVTLRPALAVDHPENGSVVIMYRPRGYFDYYRDIVRLNGVVPADLPADPVPTAESLLLQVPFGPQQSIPTRFNGERIVVRTWPEGEQSLAEYHY